jgi:hypothetical protein
VRTQRDDPFIWVNSSEQSPPPIAQTHGMVSAAWRFAPRLSLAVAYGHQLADPMRGTAPARFATFAIRLTPLSLAPRLRSDTRVVLREGGMEVGLLNARTGSAGEGDAPRPTSMRPPGDGETPVVGGVRVVRVKLAAASRVELMADFTDWEPVELASRDGVWERAVSLRSGTYRVLIRVDGGEWIAPPGLPVVDDDFGGKVGLLVVH